MLHKVNNFVNRKPRGMENMKVQKKSDQSGKKKIHKRSGDPVRNFVLVTACTCMAVVLAVGGRVTERSGRNEVYAASGDDNETFSAQPDETESEILPTGIAGVVSGVNGTVNSQKSVERIGTSCEQVMVGQRVKKIEDRVAEFDVSSSMENKVNALDEKAIAAAQNPKIMSDEDYDTLLHIVEAEAGTEDIKGRVLVANVIMNRVKNDEFPDTVTDVVWETTNGVPQFSPTYDGRINEVEVTDETKEAVRQALEGTDYSEGALFFIQKSEAEKHNVTWFEKDLKRLFKHGVHEFYTYPDEVQDTDKSDAQ